MKVKMKHISCDVESWGTRAGYDIRSIGAILFVPSTAMIAYPDDDHVTPLTDHPTAFYAACDNPLMGTYSRDHYTQEDLDKFDGTNRRYDLKRDPKTVSWWHAPEQREASRDAFANPMDLKDALMAFSFFILELSEDVRHGQAYDICVWSHGRAFDPNLLEAAFHACGLTVPWFYRAPRDTRTIFDDAGVEDHAALLKKHRYGVLHHSLHDSITQARAISEATQIILGWKKDSETVARYNTRITDQKYMINALYELLGPKAKEIADIWDRSGMVRVHHSWGPNAANLTGEERAQVLLDLENAPKTPKIQFDIDLDKRE
jgi:hypothetical protein